MPVAARRHCSTPRCPGIATHHGKCEGCNQGYERSRGTAAQRGYNAAWRKVRARILARDPVCRDAAGCAKVSTDVDHIIARAAGGGDGDENLQGLCHGHHSAKTVGKDGGWRRRRTSTR